MFTRKLAWPILLAAWWSVPQMASAQSGETDGSGEVAVLGGGAFGIGGRPAVMGSAGVAISRYGMLMVDTSFNPMGSYTIQPWPARSTVDRSLLYDFGLDFHVRIPVGERWAPYGIAGVGLLWDLVRQHTVDAQGQSLVNHFNQFNGAFHTGAGLRYYVGKTWGIRPEVRVIVSKQIYTQVMMGIFYVTPPNWP